MARPEDEKYPPPPGAQMAATDEGDSRIAEPHPREIIQRMISQRCEFLIDQIAMLREMKGQVQFMGREEARLLLKAIRSAECTGLLRW